MMRQLAAARKIFVTPAPTANPDLIFPGNVEKFVCTTVSMQSEIDSSPDLKLYQSEIAFPGDRFRWLRHAVTSIAFGPDGGIRALAGGPDHAIF